MKEWKPFNQKDLVWHVIDPDDADTFPKTDKYLLISFANFSLPAIGRCEGVEEVGYTFYEGDDDKPCTQYGLFVNAWMPLPSTLNLCDD